jgi:DNA-binding transcriptional ArsR family regulator
VGQDQYAHPAMEDVTLADVLHALSDPLRLAIVAALAQNGERGQERPWGAFCAGVAPSTLSHHMKVLRMAGIISNRRDGTRCQVSLRPELGDRFPGLLPAVLRLAEREA